MSKNALLTKGYILDNQYTVAFFLKKGRYAESYRVKDSQGKTKLLKLFSYSKLHRTQFDSNENILEIEICKKLKHPNIISFVSSGTLSIEQQKYAYAIFDFISGETVADKLKRIQTFNPYEAKDIVVAVLKGLHYLHNLPQAIIHNEITPDNIMLDLSGNQPVAKIIDFGYARYGDQSNKDFDKEGLNPFSTAPELLNKIFTVQSDIFAVGALYYHLLFGQEPWYVPISKYKSSFTDVEDIIDQARRKPLRFMDSDSKIDDHTIQIITKALHYNTDYRFKSIKEFEEALSGNVSVSPIQASDGVQIAVNKKDGEGFSAIAGMHALKELVQLDVIDALTDRERYAEYGLTIPNGMLLYGPPGCGKTFFAEKMAEEIGFNFYQIKPSDIQSKWVNASQENIKNLFTEAREHAPSIIFIDELDAVVPNRNHDSLNHMNSAVVNEFLAQMNNCGDDGIFIIGATNRPRSIDPAILRAGRLDKVIYLPPPDFEARKLMFQLYLEKRPLETDVDYSNIAKATENYVSSDIKFLSDEAARTALRARSKISQSIILQTIEKNKPSISLAELDSYRVIKSNLDKR